MRYYVMFVGPSDAEQPSPIAVDLIERPSGGMEARIDGRRVDLDVVTLDGAHGCQISVRVDGQVVDLTTEGTLPNLRAQTLGHRSGVRVESERWRATAQAQVPNRSGTTRIVRSPMPGRVVKILVARDDRVQPGQGLLVLEAMKMENEVRAHSAGRVAEVHVTAGAAVEGGAKLVTLA